MSPNEVTVLKAGSWATHPQQLGQAVARTSAGQIIPDPRWHAGPGSHGRGHRSHILVR
jgi:hypothetical protein